MSACSQVIVDPMLTSSLVIHVQKSFEFRGIFFAKLLDEHVVRTGEEISSHVRFGLNLTAISPPPCLSVSSPAINIKYTNTQAATLHECHW